MKYPLLWTSFCFLMASMFSNLCRMSVEHSMAPDAAIFGFLVGVNIVMSLVFLVQWIRNS